MSRIIRRGTTAPRYAGRPPTPTRSTERTSNPAVIGREMRMALSDMVKNVMLTAADAVEADTPIDTGHLASNWVLSTGSPYRGIDGSRESVSYGAQDAGREKVLNYDVGRDGRIYLTNNVPYLQYNSGFLTGSLMSAVHAAPRSSRPQVRRMLKAMARSAHKKGL